MTVCIAGRGGGYIFCASDRQVTVGDVESEQANSKILALTNSIVVLASDEDATLHAQILSDHTYRVRDRIAQDPTQWLPVGDAAKLYLDCWNKAKLDISERQFLLPLGLTRQAFLDQQKIMDSQLVDQLARDMIHYQMPQTAVIIAGTDTLGQHIYVIHDNDIGCYDALGFAAIGSGGRHARSQFLLARHTWNASVHEALLLTYIAKRRSEVAPGVGPETDMVMVGPQPGSLSILNEVTMKKLPLLKLEWVHLIESATLLLLFEPVDLWAVGGTRAC
jgi:20S proteasome alpha/beta subunit